MRKQRPQPTRWQTSLVSLIVLVVAACGGNNAPADGEGTTLAGPSTTVPPVTQTSAPATTVTSVSTSDSVVLYASITQPVLDELKARWDELHPDIELQMLRLSTGPLVTRLQQEIDAGFSGADVAMNTDTLWFRDQSEAGALVPLEGPSVAVWEGTEWFNGDYAIISLQQWNLSYNTDLVDEPITDYADLLRPELRGRIGMNPLVAASVVALFTHWEETYGDDFLAALAAQEPNFYDTTQAADQALGAGEIAVSAMSGLPTVVPLIEAGAPIEVAYAETGVPYVTVNMGILQTAPHPDTAAMLADFIMSEEGQAIINFYRVAPLQNVPAYVDLGDTPLVNVHAENFTPEIVDEFTLRWNEIFGQG